jgi:hypothetical protein
MLTNVNQQLNKFYSNPYVAGSLALFFILYASFAAPQLPPVVASLFGNPAFKILFMILILSVKQYNPVLAILVSIAFALSLQTLHRYESHNKLKKSGTSVAIVPELIEHSDALESVTSDIGVFDAV